MTLKALAAVKLADPLAERARDSHANAIAELQQLPAAGLIVVGDFTIPNNGAVVVPHKLGRNPAMVWISPPRVAFGAAVNTFGVIYDVVGNGVNRAQSLYLSAFSYGVPVIVTVVVM